MHGWGDSCGERELFWLKNISGIRTYGCKLVRLEIRRFLTGREAMFQDGPSSKVVEAKNLKCFKLELEVYEPLSYG